MKKLLPFSVLFFGIIFISSQLGAQSANSIMPQHSAQKPIPGHMRHSHEKPKDLRAISSYLVAYDYSEYTGTKYMLIDSYSYFYGAEKSYSSYSGWSYDTCIVYSYDTSSGTFSNSTMFINQRNANQFDTVYLTQNWDTATHSWVNSNRELIYPNAAGSYDTIIDQVWNTGSSSWANNWGFSTTYNGSNQPIRYYWWNWNSGPQTWSIYETEYDMYDGNGDDVLAIDLNWNTVTSAWDSSSRYVYTYDGQHDQTSETDYNYDTATATWLESNIYYYNGFVATQPLQEISSSVSSGIIDTTDEYIYTYNADNFELTLVGENYQGGGVYQAQAYNSIEQFFYLPDTTTGITAISPDGVRLYPNPSTGTCHLSLTSALADDGSMTITDLTGRMIKTIALTGTETTFRTNDMSTGMYICTISSGGKAVTTKKLMVN